MCVIIYYICYGCFQPPSYAKGVNRQNIQRHMGVYNNGKSIYQKKPKPIKRQVPWKKPGFSSKTRGFRIQQFFTIALSHEILSLRCSICKFSHQHGPHHIFFSTASATSSSEISILHISPQSACMKPSMIQGCPSILPIAPTSLTRADAGPRWTRWTKWRNAHGAGIGRFHPCWDVYQQNS